MHKDQVQSLQRDEKLKLGKFKTIEERAKEFTEIFMQPSS